MHLPMHAIWDKKYVKIKFLVHAPSLEEVMGIWVKNKPIIDYRYSLQTESITIGGVYNHQCFM